MIQETSNVKNAASPKVSIIIDNYNYGHFIARAIDSALAQTYPDIEIIVVDDGSTDNSRDVIASYEGRLAPVFKPNGGQASAFNAGFAKSTGDVIIFLDSDDVLFPEAIEKVVRLFENNKLTKVHWPLWVVDEHENKTGGLRPARALPQGDFRELVLQGGPTSCTSSPTSGNAWARDFLEQVFPLPEDVPYYRVCADEYLYTLAPVFGAIRAVPEPLGLYRIHGRNIYSARSFQEKIKLELEGHEQQCRALSGVLQKAGIEVDLEAWRKNSWFHKQVQAIEEISALIPDAEPFILVDDGTWNAKEIYPHRAVAPFLERNGEPWGAPEDDETAIRELARMKEKGFSFFIFAWPSFWWLEHYGEFHRYLRKTCPCILESERLVIFDLRKEKP